MPPVEGDGLKALLQDPERAMHPPFLYLGYVGFSVAFSFFLVLAAIGLGRILRGQAAQTPEASTSFTAAEEERPDALCGERSSS